MKQPLVIAALTLVAVAALPLAAAAPTVAPGPVNPVTTEPDATFAFDVTATNTGGDNAQTSIVVEKASLPAGFSVEKESGTQVIIPTKSKTFTLRMRVGPDVEPGQYSFRIYDLTGGDRTTFQTVNVTVTAPTPAETATPTRTATATVTATEQMGTETEEPTGTGAPTETSPGFGAIAALSGVCGALLVRHR